MKKQKILILTIVVFSFLTGLELFAKSFKVPLNHGEFFLKATNPSSVYMGPDWKIITKNGQLKKNLCLEALESELELMTMIISHDTRYLAYIIYGEGHTILNIFDVLKFATEGEIKEVLSLTSEPGAILDVTWEKNHFSIVTECPLGALLNFYPNEAGVDVDYDDYEEIYDAKIQFFPNTRRLSFGSSTSELANTFIKKLCQKDKEKYEIQKNMETARLIEIALGRNLLRKHILKAFLWDKNYKNNPILKKWLEKSSK